MQNQTKNTITTQPRVKSRMRRRRDRRYNRMGQLPVMKLF